MNKTVGKIAIAFNKTDLFIIGGLLVQLIIYCTRPSYVFGIIGWAGLLGMYIYLITVRSEKMMHEMFIHFLMSKKEIRNILEGGSHAEKNQDSSGGFIFRSTVRTDGDKCKEEAKDSSVAQAPSSEPANESN